jgi:hypothetical protein
MLYGCNLNMNRKQKRFQIFLAISIIFLFPIFPGYLYCSHFIETDFPSTHPMFNNPDQDRLLTDQQNKSLALEQGTSLILLETSMFRQVPYLCQGISHLTQKLVVLRC